MVDIKKEKIIGLLGGMGPYATLDIFKKILDLTPAKKDWEHLRIIIDNNPKIPSRTRYFLYKEQNPEEELIKTAKNLEKAGADFIIFGCSTAYYWKDKINQRINIPIIDMYEESRKYIINKIPDIKKIGLITADIVYDLRLFDKEFKKSNIEIIKPDIEDIEKIRKVIEMIKLNKLSPDLIKDLNGVSNTLILKGAQAILLGCTELQVIFSEKHLKIPFFDATDILVKSAIKKTIKKENG